MANTKYITDLTLLFNRIKPYEDMIRSNRQLDDIVKEWFDHAVQSRLRWAEPIDMTPGEIMLTLFGYEYDNIVGQDEVLPQHLESLFDMVDSELMDLFDRMMQPIIPEKTWKIVYVKFLLGLVVELEVGQDFRIAEWTKQNKQMSKRDKPCRQLRR